MGGPHRPIIISITGQREKVTERERESVCCGGREKGEEQEGEAEGLDREEHIGDADSRICRPEN